MRAAPRRGASKEASTAPSDEPWGADLRLLCLNALTIQKGPPQTAHPRHLPRARAALCAKLAMPQEQCRRGVDAVYTSISVCGCVCS
jgi:hypothetical protein